jgi:hypothetical protein
MMRMSLLLGSLCIFLGGCTMAPDRKVEVFGQVADETGNQQLVLRFIDVDRPVPGRGKGYDFYSLTWETKDGDKWAEKIVISRGDFEKGRQQRRWVSKLYSFDPGSGRAILQVAEEGLPDAVGSMRVTYSWRQWDVVKNEEIRVIRVCEDPFETFEKSKGEQKGDASH